MRCAFMIVSLVTMLQIDTWHAQLHKPTTTPTPLVNSATNTNFIYLDAGLEDTTSYEGETVELACGITGRPVPKYTWLKNDIKIERNPRFIIKTTEWGVRLKIVNIEKKDEARYKCIGANLAGENSTESQLTVKLGSNPNKQWKKKDPGDAKSDSIDKDDDIQPIYPETPKNTNVNRKNKNWDPDAPLDSDDKMDGLNGFCQPYIGSVCSKVIGNQSIFVHDFNHQDMREIWTKDTIGLLSKVHEISDKCKLFLHPAICASNFLVCQHADLENKKRIKISRAKKLCRDECRALKVIHCKDEYAKDFIKKLTENVPNVLETIKYDHISRILNAVECDDARTASSKDDICTRANIPLKSAYNDATCYEGDGTTFRGTLSSTKTGEQCLRWTDIGLYYEPSYFSSEQIAMDHNFCRNPDLSMHAPWCFVAQETGQEKVLCDIHKCEIGDEKESYYSGLLIGIPFICLVLLVALVIICARMRKKTLKRKPRNEKNEDKNSQLSCAPQAQLKTLLDRQSFQSCSTPPYIAQSSVSLSYELFDGSFGKVYKGEILLPDSSNGIATTPAIFKTLIPTSSPKLQTDFWKESDKMSDFHHPNITAVLGINKSSQPYFVAFETSAYGDLSEYLRSNSEVVKCQLPEPGNLIRASILPHNVLISVAVQVASAVEYLHSRNFVHCELASQNVFVCENGVIKISLVTPSSGPNYFKVSQSRPILLRWSSPEVITSLSYSTMSDIWSFGVLLWEIYSSAAVPYATLSDMEVAEAIKSFIILSSPSQCPAEMYTMMTQCWQKSPSSRLTAGEIHDRLRQSWTELNRTPSMNSSLGSDRSQGNINNNCRIAHDGRLPQLKPASSNGYHSPANQVTSKGQLSRSSLSQKSSPATSSCNQSQPESGSSVVKHHFFGNNVYSEEIL